MRKLTVKQVARAYRTTPAYLALKPETRATYAPHIDAIAAADFGHFVCDDLTLHIVGEFVKQGSKHRATVFTAFLRTAVQCRALYIDRAADLSTQYPGQPIGLKVASATARKFTPNPMPEVLPKHKDFPMPKPSHIDHEEKPAFLFSEDDAPETPLRENWFGSTPEEIENPTLLGHLIDRMLLSEKWVNLGVYSARAPQSKKTLASYMFKPLGPAASYPIDMIDEEDVANYCRSLWCPAKGHNAAKPSSEDSATMLNHRQTWWAWLTEYAYDAGVITPARRLKWLLGAEYKAARRLRDPSAAVPFDFSKAAATLETADDRRAKLKALYRQRSELNYAIQKAEQAEAADKPY